MDRQQRKKELEEKKRKLEELRRLKNQRSTAPPTAPTPSPVEAPKPSANIDSIIEEILNKPAPVQEVQPQQEAQAPSVEAPSSVQVAPRRQVNLVLEKVHSMEIAPAAVEMYDKGMQTEDFDDYPMQEDPVAPTSPVRRPAQGVATSDDVEEEQVSEEEEPQVDMRGVPLDEGEREVLESSSDFLGFLEQSTRVVERSIVLNETYDVTVDYGGDGDELQRRKKDVISLSRELFDSKYCKDHTVSTIAWSPQHDELMLAAYSRRDRSPEADWRASHSTDGTVLLWNHRVPERPEYVFTCQSEVESAIFNPFSPNLVLAGTYSGEIVMWDLRANSFPVQRTQLSSGGHTHPVFSMKCVGTANAHSLVSVSTDGQLCLWSLSNMSAPTETRFLQSEKRDVAATTIAFPSGENNDFCVGGEDGSLYRAHLHGSKAGIQKRFDAHYGPILNAEFHPGRGGSGFNTDLLLTCSMDWTVKLWSHKHSNKPLHSFESATDYVYDVQWSPVNPGVFASVDGSGSVELWNLNHDLEVPREKFSVTTEGALSALQWAPDGKQIVIGDSHGKLSLLEVSPECALPMRDDWTKLENTIAGLVDNIAQDEL